MILVGIDIGKNQHTFSIVDVNTGEILSNPSLFNNNQEGFLFLIKKLNIYSKSDLLIGTLGIIILLCSNIFLTFVTLLH